VEQRTEEKLAKEKRLIDALIALSGLKTDSDAKSRNRKANKLSGSVVQKSTWLTVIISPVLYSWVNFDSFTVACCVVFDLVIWN